MIRNTRALAKINIPPRFAETIRVEPTPSEQELYERISLLVHDINRTDGVGNKLLLKDLLAEAGSSPRAVELTLTRMLAKKALLVDHEKQVQAIRNLSRSIAREQGFAKLATQLKRSKTQYQPTQELDEKLFGENYEL